MKSKQILITWHIINIYQNELLNLEKCFVFLHGWGQNGTCFKKIFNILESKGISYISIDLPGFGKTPLKNTSMQIEDYASIVISVIEKIGIKNPSLVGHSFWWRVSICIASYYPSVKNLILIGSAGIKPKPNYLQLIVVKTGKYIFKLPLLHIFFSQVKDHFSSRDSKNSGVLREIFLNTIWNDLRKYMRKIDSPTLLIRWEKDKETPVSDAKIIQESIKNSKLEVIEQGTHFIYDEYPEEVEKLISSYISP